MGHHAKRRHGRKRQTFVGGKSGPTLARPRKLRDSATSNSKGTNGESSVDDAYVKAREIADDITAALQNAATEQDVRLQIIDRILTEVLGWDHNRIATEVNNNRGYADYALKDLESRYVGVLEAKKRGLLKLGTAAKRKVEAKLGGRESHKPPPTAWS